MVRLCFVCLGNICRSPTAEAVMAQLVEHQRPASVQIVVDSAGTVAHHAGEKPDARSTQAAMRRGVRLRGRARQWQWADWERFDYVLAVDASTYQSLEQGAPAAQLSKLFLLRSFDAASAEGSSIPDPYYGGEQGFEEVLDLCQAACEGLLKHIHSGRESNDQ